MVLTIKLQVQGRDNKNDSLQKGVKEDEILQDRNTPNTSSD